MAAHTMTDGDAAPFSFEVNFAAPEEEPPIPTIQLPDHENAVQVAEQRGYERGLADGQAGEESRLADEAARIAATAGRILEAIDGDRLRLESEAAQLTLAIARKLAREALDHLPLPDVEKLISDCLGPLRKTPHLVVRLHETDAAAIKDIVGAFARESGFEGRFVVLGEPDFQRGDCRIEWADGGIIREFDKVEADIACHIEHYFAGLRAQQTSQSEGTET